MRRQMVENIIDISVLKRRSLGTPWLCHSAQTSQRSPQLQQNTSLDLLYTFPERGDVRIVREDTQNLPVMVWFNFSPQYDEVMSLTIILSDFDWD